jgi:hypothetical protein
VTKRPRATARGRNRPDPHNGKERKRAQAVVALLAAPTIEDAARQVGIGEKTLRRWRVQPAFIAEYNRTRKELLEAATGQLRAAMTGAVAVLVSIANERSAPHAARVTAAARLLELGFYAHRIEDLAQRLEKLEKEREDDSRSWGH